MAPLDDHEDTLCAYREAMGWTRAQAAAQIGIVYTHYCTLDAGTLAPIGRKRTWTGLAQRAATFWGVAPAMLWPAADAAMRPPFLGEDPDRRVGMPTPEDVMIGQDLRRVAAEVFATIPRDRQSLLAMYLTTDYPMYILASIHGLTRSGGSVHLNTTLQLLRRNNRRSLLEEWRNG